MSEQFRTYTKFQRHINNAEQQIDANDINKIQKSINTVESNVAEIYDKSFLQKAMFTFDNNLYVNAMFIDEIKDAQYIDASLSKNIDINNKSISVSPIVNEAELVTVQISNGNDAHINDFILMVDEYIPLGASIKYYIVTNFGGIYPIKSNSTKTPCTIRDNKLAEVRVKAVMVKNAQGESPSISGIALLYFDQVLENSYGMINPDLRRFYDVQNGETILVRDRAAGDRLSKIIEPQQTTSLYYNEDGSLSYVDANDGKVKTRDTLVYGEYYNSSGRFENVLLSIENEVTKLEDTIDENNVFEVI